jgi:transcriptional regulator GlxA family with amidase domain
VQQVQEQYTRIIATKLLTQLDNNISRLVPEQGAASFERILQFIEDNLKQDISVEQLAQLAHSSQRSLYALFERHTGTTPKSFIRQKKLEQIRCSLSDPASRVRNVTEVALDYGFLHLGRFSESYKNAFGELPSDTLRRRES